MNLGGERREAFEVLEEAIYPVCTIYNMDFRDIRVGHGLNFGESLREEVNLMLVVPQYGVL